MAKETTPEPVSRQLIELSLTKPPVHSFNRQLVRIVIDTVGAMAATLWLLREDELILCEEIEETVGAVRGIRVSEDTQQQALRTAFEKGEVVVLKDVLEGVDALGLEPFEQKSVVFIPVAGLRGNLGVLRLIFPPSPAPMLSRQIQLAETLSGYYSLYSAQRILTVQYEERRDIDRLSKAILQLQHYTFSRQLPEVIVNSAAEVARIDRVVLLTGEGIGELRVRAASSVSETQKKGAWARLVCELGEIVLQTGQPLEFFEGVTQPDDIEDEELRRQMNSYLLMTSAKSLLIFPLSSGTQKAGVLLFENFGQEGPLTGFERVLCSVYASHAASALVNYRLFEGVPFSRFYAKKIDREIEAVKRGRPWFGKIVKWGVTLLVVAGLVWLVGFRAVPEKVGARCFVVPDAQRIVTARIDGQIESIGFRQGDYVEQSHLLIKLRTDQLELRRDQERELANNIKAEIIRKRGQAQREMDPEIVGSLLAEVVELEHSLRAKEIGIELLGTQLDDCYVKATISGVVVEPEDPEKLLGVWVRAGQQLCRIGSIADRVRVRIAVPDDRIADVKDGQEVEIRLRPLINKELLRGRIETVAERSTPYKNANVFLADVILDNPLVANPAGGAAQHMLKPGMTGKAKIIRPGKSTYLVIYGSVIHRKLKYWFF